jgi:adenine-specific DNA-methyltransferase
MKVDSLKHKKATRVRIPSKQEAGFEPVPEEVIVEFPLNRVIHRGQDPELHWVDKYGADNRKIHLQVYIRSLYRHEHIAPEVLNKRLYRIKEDDTQRDLFINELFGDTLQQVDELEKPGSYYRHTDGWTNRLIQGDSLLVMTSLLEREGMAGKVQMIYIDPPYGIKYGSNWQMRLNDRNVKDGDDTSLTGEPEVIKAFRDTWELGIHSYLSYLRERLLAARELLTESGSCFVQISDENVHLVRCLMDEVFGGENFVSLISFVTTSGFNSSTLARNGDYFIWYAKDINAIKYRQLYLEKDTSFEAANYKWLLLPDGTARGVTVQEQRGEVPIPDGARIYQPGS